jgi:hypothetical protein
MTLDHARMKFGATGKSRPRSDIFLCSIKEGTGYRLVRHYKTQKAYSYYQSGFDDTIYCTSLNGTKVVKSSVSPSEYKK